MKKFNKEEKQDYKIYFKKIINSYQMKILKNKKKNCLIKKIIKKKIKQKKIK